MRVSYRKNFLKDLAKIPSKTRKRIEIFVFKQLPKTNSIFEMGIVEQMKGYHSCYKVRFGSYRIGFKIENDVVLLERALHRKDIYRYFP